MKKYAAMLLFALLTMMGGTVYADVASSPLPAVISQVSGDAAQASVPLQTFLADLFTSVTSLGGVPGMLKVALVVMLLISALKVSTFAPLWAKLGSLQIWLAPALGLIGGAIMSFSSGTFSLSQLFAYVSAGAGAVFLHELLELVKLIPGIGAIYVSLINVVEGALGSPAAATPLTARAWKSPTRSKKK